MWSHSPLRAQCAGSSFSGRAHWRPTRAESTAAKSPTSAKNAEKSSRMAPCSSRHELHELVHKKSTGRARLPFFSPLFCQSFFPCSHMPGTPDLKIMMMNSIDNSTSACTRVRSRSSVPSATRRLVRHCCCCCCCCCCCDSAMCPRCKISFGTKFM